jgi:peptidoglycan/LPS O-acetylase OafA/YrhL
MIEPGGASVASGQARSAGRYLSCLQAYRGVAALAVLLFHANILFRNKLGITTSWARIASPGSLGVDFFFVLSGFIIFYTNLNAIGRPAAAGKYIYRRLTRIYPVFFGIFLIKLAFSAVGGGVPAGKSGAGYLISSLLLLPQPVSPYIDVAWTLSYEMTFYTLFLLLILCGRGVWLAICLHALSVVAMNLPGMPALTFPASFVFSPYFLEFYLGCLACRLVLHQAWSLRGALAMCLAATGFIAAGYVCYAGLFGARHLTGGLSQSLFWGTTFGLLVLGSVALGGEMEQRIPRLLKNLGDASYSIYLAHGSIIIVGLGVLASHKALILQHTKLFIFTLTLVSLAGSYAYYLVVEKNLQALCRRVKFGERKASGPLREPIPQVQPQSHT